MQRARGHPPSGHDEVLDPRAAAAAAATGCRIVVDG